MTSHTPTVAGASDIGLTRRENQDHFLIAKLRRQLQVVQTDVETEGCEELYGIDDGQLLVVADGMGGHSDGAMASGTAVKACSRYVLDMMQWFLKLSPENEDDFVEELKQCVAAAQESIWGSDQPSGRDSGTTVTMAYILRERMYVVHAGDSRCYLLRDGQMRQLTRDHTIAQKLLEQGALSAEDAEKSQWRHVLWNCVGGRDHRVTAEAIKVKLQPNDQVLLCSDGLTGMLSDDEIRNVLQESESPQQAVHRLIDSANAAGGKDNIAAIVATDFEQWDESRRRCFNVARGAAGNLEDTVDLEN